MHIHPFENAFLTGCFLTAATGLHSFPEHLSLGLRTNAHTQPSNELIPLPTAPAGWLPCRNMTHSPLQGK